jgi:transcriptional regulator with XRE-family HTH domain
MITRDDNAIVRETLLAIRLELDARGLPLKVIASKAGVSYSTFLSWFPAGGTPQIPSLAALRGLARALPGDLLSLLVPDGFHIVPDPSGLDYDDFAAGCLDFASAHAQARHPNSECGVDIGPREKSNLDDKVVVMLPIGRVG